jgi:hypothetical protein
MRLHLQNVDDENARDCESGYTCCGSLGRPATDRYVYWVLALIRENLQVVLAAFSTLSSAVGCFICYGRTE